MAGVTSATSSAAARAGKLRAVATGLGSEKGKGGEVAGLTAISRNQTLQSGTSWCGGNGKGDLR